ncbi:MAG: thioesterase domain-containing protein [Cyanobacteria bacterium P01_E01_bin.35]
MTTTTQTPWLPQINTNPRAKLRLFCLPYAGGSTYIYDRWGNFLPDTVEVCPIELPGRRKRFIEIPYDSINVLVSDLGEVLLPYLDKPFALFGHSMGGRVSSKLTRLLRCRYHLQPVHLLISACRATQIPRSNPSIHHLDDAAFTQEIIRLGGTPQAVLNDKEIMELILPTLKADFKAIETHFYQAESPLNLPLTVFGGDSDTEVTPEELAAWREQTTGKFSLEIFTGGHFFIESGRSLLLKSVCDALELYV